MKTLEDLYAVLSRLDYIGKKTEVFSFLKTQMKEKPLSMQKEAVHFWQIKYY
jgi:hypothetical protein